MNNPINEEFKYDYKRDPELDKDPDIKIGDQNVKYHEILNTFPINKEVPIRVAVYWEDIVQFTSIALIDVLNTVCGCNAKIDIEHFLNRPNEYWNGMQYIYTIFSKSLDKETIETIKKKFYWRLLELSPKSIIFSALQSISKFCEKIDFVFPYRFQNCAQLECEIDEVFGSHKKGSEKIVKFHYGNIDTLNRCLLEESCNCIITPNITNTYEYILNNKLKRIAILGPLGHNGISDEMAEIIFRENQILPNYCSIDMWEEQFAI